MTEPVSDLEDLARRIVRCRICRDTPRGVPLLHEPRPILQLAAGARVVIASQAPGLRAHVSGVPFDDPSGRRLRDWMGVAPDVFYDPTRVAIAPMAFCFPGYDAAKTDLPPRRECAPAWHDAVFARLAEARLLLAIGRYAQDFHARRLGLAKPAGRLEDIVRAEPVALGNLRVVALPHPSWRNSSWLRRHPWFERETVPRLRTLVAAALDTGPFVAPHVTRTR